MTLFAFIAINLSCDKELYDDAISSSKKASIREVKFDELLKEQKFKNLLTTVSGNHLQRNSSARSAFENQYGFTIVNTSVKVIETDSLTSYTMLIERDGNTNETFFENLVIQEDIFSNQKAAIYRYTPTEIIDTEHNSFSFRGQIQKHEITNFTGFNRGYDQTTNSDDCYIDATMCNYGGEEHPAGPNCTRTYVIRVKVVCAGGSSGGGGFPSDDDFWSGSGSGNYDGLGYPYGYGGGGGPGDNIFTPLEELPNIQEIISSPIKHLSAPRKTPCGELFKLTSNIHMQVALVNLQSKTNLTRESGYSISKSSATAYNNPVACNASPGNPNEIKMPTGGKNIGAFHTHPLASATDVVPMFSDGDINWLFWVAQRNEAPRQGKIYEEFFLTLTVPQGTYAIKIKDWIKFASFRDNKAWKNIDDGLGGQLEDLRDKYNDIGANGNHNSMINAFLEILRDFDAGIGLYEANSELNGWSELVLAPGASSYNDTQPRRIPCQ